jgi:hypothetical protein
MPPNDKETGYKYQTLVAAVALDDAETYNRNVAK